MTERPILFSGPMVRALLAGRKTQTRRIVKGVDDCPHGYDVVKHAAGAKLTLAGGAIVTCPYGIVGDRLWVRENGWERPDRTPRMMREGADTWEPFYYDASIDQSDHEQFKEWGFRRRPSIHMPRWASRLKLELTDVRAERLGELSEADARAEGMLPRPGGTWTSDEGQPVSQTARRAFEDLWHSINGAWLPDVWVWVVTFRRAS